MARSTDKPIVLITGSEGNIGSALKAALADDYTVVGCDREGKPSELAMDITSDESVAEVFRQFREEYGTRIAAVVHLAAYFDFSGEDSPLYESVNIKGTKRLLEALQAFEVERFIYSGTMLVHRPGRPGERITEETPIAPGWAYPVSKAKTEEIIREAHGEIPCTMLHLAGLYDDETAVPTLSHQIARIYERDMKSHLYAGDLEAGQSFIHKEDLIAVFRAVIDHRNHLPQEHILLAGESDPMSYAELQNAIGELIHGSEEWKTFSLPKPVAKAGAWVEEKAEPVVPDAFDKGEKPFIRPFMIDLASDHYALDIGEARRLLGWEPKHDIREGLPRLVAALKRDPASWYRKNKVNPPDWIESASEKQVNVEDLRRRYDDAFRHEHRRNLWGAFANIGLGVWLLSSPATLGYASVTMSWSDILSGIAVILLGLLSLSPRLAWTRFGLGAVGLWLLAAPLLFWAPEAASYLNDTIVGTLLLGFALLLRPFPCLSPLAAMTGPDVPPGWDYSPSSWFQRAPIIVLALIGFLLSRYMTAYQLGHIDAVWDPFFGGAIPGDGKNGTEEIITSSISEAFPVPDAGLGALTYMLEILTGMMGSTRRWRTMPWLVLLFGFMIVPLGAVSIIFIIIQPILLGTWCAVCLIAAAAMLLQIPYSFDEIVATLEFLNRRRKAGRPVLRILFTGDTDDDHAVRDTGDDFAQPPLAVARDMLGGGVNVPWNLGLCCLIGLWLMLTRMTLGTEGGMADADHLIGSLVLTVAITAWAEVMRMLRFLIIPLGAALLVTPFWYGADIVAMLASLGSGCALILLSLRRGPIRSRWGAWGRYIV